MGRTTTGRHGARSARLKQNVPDKKAICTKKSSSTPAKASMRMPANPGAKFKPAPPRTRKPRSDVDGEKRLRRYRDKPPQTFFEIFERATTQRFFVLNRQRCGSDHTPQEIIELAGTTGNIYQVHITNQPKCNCPHGQAGNQCKHWIYVMSRVLHAKWEYVYQLALLSSELLDLFQNAPQPVNFGSEESSKKSAGKTQGRKPVEGDCSICFAELVDDKGSQTEDLVWCRAACGQNMHKQCFRMWEISKGQGKATCPYCRAQWEAGPTDMHDVADAAKKKAKNEEGYVNVAQELGLSGERDYSVYSPWFLRSRGLPYPDVS